jgi:catechol 2,3-dioxygenase-like lactoylglutathione lyase family enzyme
MAFPRDLQGRKFYSNHCRHADDRRPSGIFRFRINAALARSIVGETEFDDIFGRVKAEGLAYGSGPFTPDDMKINNWNGGRGVYFRDPNGHLLELFTRDYSAETMPK